MKIFLRTAVSIRSFKLAIILLERIESPVVHSVHGQLSPSYKAHLFVLAAEVTSFDHSLGKLAAFLTSLMERWNNLAYCAFSSWGIPRSPVLPSQAPFKDCPSLDDMIFFYFGLSGDGFDRYEGYCNKSWTTVYPKETCLVIQANMAYIIDLMSKIFFFFQINVNLLPRGSPELEVRAPKASNQESYQS